MVNVIRFIEDFVRQWFEKLEPSPVGSYLTFDLMSFRYQVYPTCRNTSGVLGFSVTVETQATKFR